MLDVGRLSIIGNNILVAGKSETSASSSEISILNSSESVADFSYLLVKLVSMYLASLLKLSTLE